MKLIDFDGLDFKIADEALLISPIREMFQKDKSKKKEDFWKQISYMWFMCDPRSSYMYIVDPEQRAKEIKKQEGLGEEWMPSELLKNAMDIYKNMTVTSSSILLESMRKGVDTIRRFMDGINLFDVDKNGKPIYQVSTITSTLRQIPELAKALADAEKSLAKDFATDDKARGTAEKAIGEDI